MSLDSQVQAFTTVTEDLLQSINIKKSELSAAVSTVQPAIGQSNGVYSSSVHQIEAFARYNRVLIGADIQRIAAKSAALGAARGRAWA